MTNPNPYDAKQKAKVKSDIEQFRELVENANVVVVGKDPDYVPDSPRLQNQMEDNE